MRLSKIVPSPLGDFDFGHRIDTGVQRANNVPRSARCALFAHPERPSPRDPEPVGVRFNSHRAISLKISNGSSRPAPAENEAAPPNRLSTCAQERQLLPAHLGFADFIL